MRCEEEPLAGLGLEEDIEKDILLEIYSAMAGSGFKEQVQAILLQQAWPPHSLLPVLDVLKDLFGLTAERVARVHDLVLQASKALLDSTKLGIEPSRLQRMCSALLKICIEFAVKNTEAAFILTCRQVLQMVNTFSSS